MPLWEYVVECEIFKMQLIAFANRSEGFRIHPNTRTQWSHNVLWHPDLMTWSSTSCFTYSWKNLVFSSQNSRIVARELRRSVGLKTLATSQSCVRFAGFANLDVGCESRVITGLTGQFSSESVKPDWLVEGSTARSDRHRSLSWSNSLSWCDDIYVWQSWQVFMGHSLCNAGGKAGCSVRQLL